MIKKMAMIGCEGIGAYHLDHLMQLTDMVELAGFCDLVPGKAEKFCKKARSGKAYTDFKQMYDEVKPDMVLSAYRRLPTERSNMRRSGAASIFL